MHWETNSNFTQLPDIAVGDIVHLRQRDGFSYLVKAMVSNVSSSNIDAVVKAVFDGNDQGQVTADDSLRIIGSTLSFTAQSVHKILKRHDGE